MNGFKYTIVLPNGSTSVIHAESQAEGREAAIREVHDLMKLDPREVYDDEAPATKREANWPPPDDELPF